MNDRNSPKLTAYSRKLRKEMTKEERHLWYDCLKKLPVTVHRQKVMGKYIVDFYCANAKLVIEIDGSQHYQEKGIEVDRERDEYLYDLGLTVKRYSNADISQRFEGVCEDIYKYISNVVSP